jgi:hypothetical protein
MQTADLSHILRQHADGQTIDVANDTVAATRTLLVQSADAIDCQTSEIAKLRAALRGLVSLIANDASGNGLVLRSHAYAEAQRLCAWTRNLS